MAFQLRSDDSKKIYLVQANYIGGPHEAKEWLYYTEDSVATVDTSGYITDAEVAGMMSVGDRVWVYQCVDKDDLTAGIEDLSLHLVMSNNGTDVDLSDDLLGATVTVGD